MHWCLLLLILMDTGITASLIQQLVMQSRYILCKVLTSVIIHFVYMECVLRFCSLPIFIHKKKVLITVFPFQILCLMVEIAGFWEKCRFLFSFNWHVCLAFFRIQEIYAWNVEIFLEQLKKRRNVHKFLFCSLPKWVARHVVCTRLSKSKQ